MSTHFFAGKRYARLLLLSLAAATSLGATEVPLDTVHATPFQRVHVGDFVVTALRDGSQNQALATDREKLTTSSDGQEPKGSHFVSASSFLIDTGKGLVLIDVGTGVNDGNLNFGHLAANLRAAGYRPDQISLVLLTDFDSSSVAGITSVKGVHSTLGQLVFPNAQIGMPKDASDFWLSAQNAKKASVSMKRVFAMDHEAAAPYIAANQWAPFSGNAEIVPGIKPVALDGSTPGKTGYLITSRGQQFFVLGGVIRTLQTSVSDPEVAITMDQVSANATGSRNAILDNVAAGNVLIGGTRMPWPAIGHIRKEGSGYSWVAATSSQNLYGSR